MEHYRERIKLEAARRSIPALFHFTQMRNLESIVEHGLVPRQALDDARHPYRPSDRFRLDGKPDTISLSISHVNYSMFEAKRLEDPSSEWVVLLLDPAILWEKHCRFCYRNAASKEMTSARGAQAGPKTFNWLFIAEDGTDCGWTPARNDAEVLVYGNIEPHYIGAAWIDEMSLARYVQGQLDRISDEDLSTFVRPFLWPGIWDQSG